MNASIRASEKSLPEIRRALQQVRAVLAGQGAILGASSYNGGSGFDAPDNFAAVDATNMKVTFTAPDSGRVVVRMTALVEAAPGGQQLWSLMEGGVVNSDVAQAVYRVEADAMP